MTSDVKGAAGRAARRRRPGRALRTDLVAETEQRILTAATELFRQNGYAATTLAAVARAAEVGERTVYVRFGTKGALFKRVVDVAVAGNTGRTSVSEQTRQRPAMTAPTATERITDFNHMGRMIMERTGELFAVAQEAAATEPLIEQSWQAGRAGTRHGVREFWIAMAQDGLLPESADIDWLADTTTVLSEPETYLLIGKVFGWDLDRYEQWLAQSFVRLASAATPRQPR
jgi:AcrR family transcriptional regulator